ncbi:MAG: hypothetical protein P8013_08770 [Candidatus Sulfobium sp.]
MSEDTRRTPLFVGILASICWIFLVMLVPAFFSSRGGIMPFDPWIIVAGGLIGAVVCFFAAAAVAGVLERFRNRKK